MTETENQSEQHTTWSLFRRLWRDWVRQHIGRLIMIFVFMMMISALSGAYPVLIGYVFNGLNEASHNLIWQIPALIIGIAAIRSAAMYGLAKQLAVLSLLVTRHIQKQIASHVIMADLGDIMSQPSGTFVSRMTNDVNIIREALVRLINNLIKDSLTIIVLIGVLISFDWMLTLIVLGIYPLAMTHHQDWSPSAS